MNGPRYSIPDSRLSDEARCPECRSPNLEESDPTDDEHTCRDCGCVCTTVEANANSDLDECISTVTP